MNALVQYTTFNDITLHNLCIKARMLSETREEYANWLVDLRNLKCEAISTGGCLDAIEYQLDELQRLREDLIDEQDVVFHALAEREMNWPDVVSYVENTPYRFMLHAVR